MSLVQKKSRFFIYFLTALLMLAASLWDLQLSDAVYAPDNLFVEFFQKFGESMSVFAGFGGAACLFASAVSLPRGKKKTIRYWIAGFGLYFAAIGLIVVSITDLIKTHEIAAFTVNMAELALATLFFLFCLKNTDKSDADLLFRIGIVMVVISLSQTLVINLIKNPWGRPRYRSIVITEVLEFRPWWIAGQSLRDAFEGILDHEEFKSFPSGHVSAAACSFVLPLLSAVVRKQKEKNPDFICGHLDRLYNDGQDQGRSPFPK